MKIGFAAVVLVLAVILLVQGCDSDDGDNTGNQANAGSGGGGSTCADICAITDSLDCPNEASCVTDCETEMSGVGACQSEMDAQISCTTGRPVSDFECDLDFGDAVLKQGICEAEGTALLNCLIAQM